MSLLGYETFYFDTTRKMISYFGTIFNNIHITRTNSAGEVTELIKVPIQFAPGDKAFVRNDADPNIQRPTAMTLPRMSYELTGLQYDSERKTGTMNRVIELSLTDNDKMRRQYNAVPYNFSFSLYVRSKFYDDGSKIVEQILPFFTPEFTATVYLVPEIDMKRDIPIVLVGPPSIEDTYDGDLAENRQILWTLQFILKGYIFGPIVERPIIKLANTQFFVGNTSTTNTIVQRIKVIPGLDANGDGTTNVAVTIPSANIAANSDWDYIVIHEDASD